MNVPEPSVVQTPLVLPPEIVPFKDAEIAPGQIPKLLPAFTIGPGSMVTATSKLSAAHPTEAAITFVIVYVPAVLDCKLISPVNESTKVNPVGVEMNTPLTAPALKLGKGLMLF